MADPRFFKVTGSFRLEALAEVAAAEIGAGGDPDAVFTDVAPLNTAGPQDVGFLDNSRYIDSFTRSKAGVCLVHPDHASKAPPGMALLVTEQPYHGFARVAAAFYPKPEQEAAIARSAVVDETATLGTGCRLEAGAVIGAGAEIGARCHIGANAVIGPGVLLGDDCVIGPGVSLACCIIGDRVILHAGVSIGQDGFGFALGGGGGGGHLKVPQLGRVLVEDDVEIGANATIDRGTAPDTVIGAGTKIDNLVQIAHNVQIGRNCVVVSQVGISGSTRIGDFVMMGGQAGLTGHLTIGDGARIAAQSGVMRDVEPKGAVGGSPAMPMRQWLRGIAVIERMVRKKGG